MVTGSNGEEVMRINYTPYGEIDQAHSGKLGCSEGASDTSYEKCTRYGLPWTKIYNISEGKNAGVTHKFTGQEYDPENELYYYNARYYDPSMGIFTTADTVVPDPGDPLSYNRYMYVRGNPVKYIDPTGNFTTIPPWHCFTGPTRRCDLDDKTKGVSTLDDISKEHDKAGAIVCFAQHCDPEKRRDYIEADLKWIGEGLRALLSLKFIWDNARKAFEDVEEWYDVVPATGEFILNAVVDTAAFIVGTALFAANIVNNLLVEAFSGISPEAERGAQIGGRVGFWVGVALGVMNGGLSSWIAGGLTGPVLGIASGIIPSAVGISGGLLGGIAIGLAGVIGNGLVGAAIGATIGGLIGSVTSAIGTSTKNWDKPSKWKLPEGKGRFKNWKKPWKWRFK